jgi:hypothetical protein
VAFLNKVNREVPKELEEDEPGNREADRRTRSDNARPFKRGLGPSCQAVSSAKQRTASAGRLIPFSAGRDGVARGEKADECWIDSVSGATRLPFDRGGAW